MTVMMMMIAILVKMVMVHDDDCKFQNGDDSDDHGVIGSLHMLNFVEQSISLPEEIINTIKTAIEQNSKRIGDKRIKIYLGKQPSITCN